MTIKTIHEDTIKTTSKHKNDYGRILKTVFLYFLDIAQS